MRRQITIGWLLVALTASCWTFAQESNALARRIDRLTRWLRSPRESIRLEAVTELQDLPAQNAEALLLSVISDTSSVVRAAAAVGLERIDDKNLVPRLRPLLQDSDEHVRASAVWILAHCGGKDVLPDVQRLCLDDPSGLVRFRAVWGLALIRDQSALPTAIDALGDYIPAVRERSALMAIDALADQSVGERLVKKSSSQYPPTRRIVMYLLSRYGEINLAVPVLSQHLQDADPLVRAEAALSLGKRQSRESIVNLLPLLKDPDEHVRGAGAHALGLIGADSALAGLRPSLNDRSAFVRAVAAEAMQQLGDKTVQPPDGFKSAELFTYPVYSPEHTELYR